MNKKMIAALAAICYIIIITNKTVYCMSFNLTNNQINEALEYGGKNRRKNLKEFTKPWVVHLGEKTGWATLWTPYHNIAFKAKMAAVERRELSQREIFKALHIKESMTFVVSVFGDYTGFARGYNSILYCKDKTIYPIFTYFPEYAEPSEFYPDAPAFLAGCVYKFPTEDIDPSSEVTLIVTSPEGKEFKFVFNLAKTN